MYRCSLIPYAVRSALRTEHVRSLRNGISLKMAKYPVKSTSQSTYGRMERTSNVHMNFPQNTELRTTKINQLKSSYAATSSVIVRTATQQERVTEASLRVAWVLGKHKKPFSDAEIVNTDDAQLMVFVRFFDEEKGEFHEDVLGVTNLHGHTRGDDIYEAVTQMLRDREIDVKNVVSIATDGAPSMIGRERGLVARLRAHHPDLMAYHCIIHQMVLCANLGERYMEVMTTVMKLVNFLRASSALQHLLLRSFLIEVNATFDDLLLHNHVRWLSKGKRKLEVFKCDLQQDLLYFPRLLDQTAGKHHHHNYAEFLDKLIKNFQSRFEDFPLGKQVLLCIENPFLVKNIAEFSTEAMKVFKWASAASLQTELIELQENLQLQESHCDPVTFWTKMVTAAGVPLLQKMALQILTMFPSTYCCESAFSTMNMVKDAYRSTLTNEHLHQCLRLALTPFMPKFKQLVTQRRCHLSH
ncbi:General transcription factor II-I repeat domain-containing protein 2B [Anabarilius grahami]|uniref:General transcription factor II-I repeat domain-containing protein 2B n=1 Tax=Anabarilius grahami TaxID=495550 RepID=A0A3N0YME1_ANAGA|nr:General transcription factor II-I repeat domain-containing protein 2B [Anabarilius grahami]